MKKLSKKSEARRNPAGSNNSIGNRSVFSYHSAGNRASASTSEPRIKKPTKSNLLSRRHWHYMPSMMALLAVLISMVYLTTISSNPRLVLINQNKSPNLFRDSNVYQQAASKVLSRSIVDKSKLTIDSEGFSRDMKSQFPELQNVAIIVPLMGRRPVVELIAAEPVLRLTARNQSYLLDINGRILMRSIDKPGVTNLPEVNEQVDVKEEVGAEIMTGDNVAFITTFVNQLKSNKILISNITLPSKASELQIKIKDKPYYVKANFQTNPSVAVGQFLAVKQKLELEKKIPNEYIDVRVEEKVFVK